MRVAILHDQHDFCVSHTVCLCRALGLAKTNRRRIFVPVSQLQADSSLLAMQSPINIETRVRLCREMTQHYPQVANAICVSR